LIILNRNENVSAGSKQLLSVLKCDSRIQAVSCAITLANVDHVTRGAVRFGSSKAGEWTLKRTLSEFRIGCVVHVNDVESQSRIRIDRDRRL